MSQVEQQQQRQQQLNGQDKSVRPKREVLPRPKRRTYSREYKLRILAEAARCKRGELGGLLRREGLYYSTLNLWRKQRSAGKLDGRTQQRKEEAAAQARELKRLRRENARLQQELAKAEAIIAVQKKLSALLGLLDSKEKSPSK